MFSAATTKYTSSTKLIMVKVTELYDRIVDRNLTVRRMYVVANHVKQESDVKAESVPVQLSLFDDPEETERKENEERAASEKERRIQETAISLKKKFGKNAILKGMNLQEGATSIERNRTIGGHKAGDQE